jgi:hypothetical protein
MKRLLVLFVLLVSSSLANAAEAKVFTIKLSNGTTIRTDRDHFDVVFQAGFISQNDDFIHRLLSHNRNTSASISANGTYFDGDQLKNAWIVENSDIPSNGISRPWGVSNKVLLQGIPADTVLANISVRFALFKDDRLKQALGILQSGQPAVGVSVQPYLTYGNLIDNFFNTFFGIDKTRYPFVLDTGLSDPTVTTSDGMLEHYLVGISPSKEGDTSLDSLTSLCYDPTTQSLRNGTQIVTDHTYAVFLIKNAPAPNIPSLLFSSNAPWSALALGTFYQSPLPKILKRDDIAGVEVQYIKNLSDCTGLLKRELRFSAYDRAQALLQFATRAKKSIADSCAAGGLSVADCKTPQLDNFISGIQNVFPLTPSSQRSLVNDSVSLGDAIAVQMLRQQQQP